MNHKKAVCLLLSMCLLFAAMPAIAAVEKGFIGDNVSYSFNTVTGILTVVGTGPMDDFSQNWITWPTEPRQLIIEEGVTTVGANFLHNCLKLDSISLPSTLQSIGENAFTQCNITELDCPPNVTIIGKNAFSLCERLLTVSIPGVQTIGDSAFSSCNLRSISGEQVTSLGKFAFSFCDGLHTIDFPNLETLGVYAFWECTSLESITIPEKVKTISNNCFQDCTNLRNVTFHANVSGINEAAFSGCTSLQEIVFPKKMTHLAKNAFQNCGLESVVIPENVQYIKPETFDLDVAVKCIAQTLPDGSTPPDNYIMGWTPFTITETPEWTNAPVENMTVTDIDETNPLIEMRYAVGVQDNTYFQAGSGQDIALLDKLTADDTVTFYSLDIAGNETIKVVTAEYIDKLAPTILATPDGTLVRVEVTDQ